MEKKDLIYNYALDSIKKKEHCSYSLLKRLYRKYPNDKNIIKLVMKELIIKKYIDDYDYINSYIYKRINKYKGSAYIKYKLVNIGFNEKYIDSNLVKYKELESSKINEYVKENIDKEKNIINKLVSKGYSSNLIYNTLMCYNIFGDKYD